MNLSLSGVSQILPYATENAKNIQDYHFQDYQIHHPQNYDRTDKYSESRVKHRFAILIPTYQDDDYIPYTVKSFLQQEYPIDCYDIIVISDHLKPETNRQLAQYPITLLQARFKKSSKMKSVKAAMSQLQEGQYDIVLIMNADNVVDTNFLEVVNN